MVDVVNSLLQDHANMARLLDAIEQELAAFDRGERPDYDIIQGALEYCLNYPDLYHHPKEDLVWDRLQERDAATAAALGDLRSEHKTLAELTRRFAAAVHAVLHDLEVPRGSFDHAAREFLGRYRHHMAVEEERFFPAAVGKLTADDWAEIETEMTERNDPRFDAQSGERFTALREKILTWAAEGA